MFSITKMVKTKKLCCFICGKCRKFEKPKISLGHLLILVSTLTGCVSITTFISLVGIPIAITSSAAGLKICVITKGIKNS